MNHRVCFTLRDGTLDRRETPLKMAALNIIQLIFFSDLLAARFSVGLAGILHGISLLWPGANFGYDFYRVLFSVLPRESWSLLFFLLGSIQWTLIFKDGLADTPTHTFFSAVQAALWTFVCITIYIAVYPPITLIVGEIIIAWLAFWIWVRAGVDSDN